MRRTLALVSAAVTSMVAIAFLIPLAIIVRDVARDRAFTSAQLAGAAIEPVLAVSTSRATLERAIDSTQAGEAGQLAVYLQARGRPTGCVAGPSSAAPSAPATPTCARPRPRPSRSRRRCPAATSCSSRWRSATAGSR